MKEAGATLLHIHLHTFTDGGGISGVAVLAESHISVHTWPEKGYAAFDVFMCGDAEPRKALGRVQGARSIPAASSSANTSAASSDGRIIYSAGAETAGGQLRPFALHASRSVNRVNSKSFEAKTAHF